MSDREGPGFDHIELRALAAVLRDGRHVPAAAPALGPAMMWAHVLWRRRAGALAALPVR